MANAGAARAQTRDYGARMERVADGVYAIIHDDATDEWPHGNTGVVVTDRGVLVIDATYLPSRARADIALIRSVTNQPVRYLVYTHWHFDHNNGRHRLHRGVSRLDRRERAGVARLHRAQQHLVGEDVHCPELGPPHRAGSAGGSSSPASATVPGSRSRPMPALGSRPPSASARPSSTSWRRCGWSCRTWCSTRAHPLARQPPDRAPRSRAGQQPARCDHLPAGRSRPLYGRHPGSVATPVCRCVLAGALDRRAASGRSGADGGRWYPVTGR